MKKIISITLLMVYAFSVSGLSIDLSFCCGKIKKASCSLVAKNCCNTSGKENKTNCCNTQQLCCDSNPGIENIPANTKGLQDENLCILKFKEDNIYDAATNHKNPVTFISPGFISPPIFLLNCVFRL